MIPWLAATGKTSGLCSAFAKPSSGVIGLEASSFPSGLLSRIKPGEGRGFLPFIYFFLSPPTPPQEEAGISPELPAAPQAGGRSWAPPDKPSSPAAEEQNPEFLSPQAVAGQCLAAAAAGLGRFRGSQLPLPAPGRHPQAAARGQPGGAGTRHREQPGARARERKKSRSPVRLHPAPPGYQLNGKA